MEFVYKKNNTNNAWVLLCVITSVNGLRPLICTYLYISSETPNMHIPL